MEILHETAQYIVCLKEPGLSSEDSPSGSMPALLREHWKNPDAYVGVVHRLDVVTGGVMVYAKTPAAAAALSRQIAEGTLRKQYLCVCAGVPEPASGSMEDFLFRDTRRGKVFPVKTQRKGAKPALLDYEVLQVHASENAALCRVRLHTGRTHQIRVQFASRQHPLWGDGKYGSRVKGPLALWCEQLTFTPPGENAPKAFACPPPKDSAFAQFHK